ncbi:MAG TPA: hypothetical protein PKD00_01930 [Burkholderiales bacterium]|nr:hypothetical protein [Burkholderiales bacterium]
MIINIKGNIINTEGIDTVTDTNKDCNSAYDTVKKEMVENCVYFFQILFISGVFIEISDDNEVKIKEYYNKLVKALS